MRNKFYSLALDEKEANLTIYGDITSFPYLESDVSAFNLVKELDELDIDLINVYINSYGGEVAEGLAIYNALKRNKAKVITYVDGFACSIASVIAMAGDERKMYKSSLIMIHNAWTVASGNAGELRKQADDLETITDASISAYMSNVNISEEELKELLDSESWIKADEALKKGFITEIVEEEKNDKHNQSVKNIVMQKLTKGSNSFASLEKKVDKLFDLLEKKEENPQKTKKDNNPFAKFIK